MTPARALKVLIVDDHAGIRRLLVDRLHGFPVECIECSDGNSAISAYAQHQPDWVTMDVDLPGLDGLAATRRIRELNPRARVLIVTQHDLDDFRDRAKSAGASGFLLKEHLNRLPEMLGLTPSSVASAGPQL